ncbi:MAG: acetolactate synthase small subunit [Campylobacterota bacterium]
MHERRVISVIVSNEHGVLSRISGLFAGRGYNIETLTVAPIPGTDFSRFTISTKGSVQVIEQITKQLHKLIPTYKIMEHKEHDTDNIQKEMALLKFPIEQSIADIDALSKAYNGGVVNVGQNVIVVMVADDPFRVKQFIKASQKYKPVEIVRSGVVAIER